MQTTYKTTILGYGNHAAIEIPEKNLAELGGSKRVPVKVTLKGYTYQSTAAVMDGKCLVVFPTKDRDASGFKSGDTVTVKMVVDSGYRHVNMPAELSHALQANALDKIFHDLSYSKRKEFARQVSEAKTEDTKTRRIDAVVEALRKLN